MAETAKLTLARRIEEDALPEAKGILSQVKRQVGMIPNMYAYMANAPGLLETYIRGQEAFRKGSGFSPIEQEVILLSISFENECEYCMAAHSTIADTQSKVPPEITEAIRNGAELPNSRLSALSTFTRIMVVKRGRPSQAEVEKFLSAGYSEEQVLQIVLAVGIKTLSNYTNHLCNTPVDAPFAARRWERPVHAAKVS